MCYFLLEQSAPFLPELHEHWPVAESHIPSPLQLFGQDNSCVAVIDSQFVHFSHITYPCESQVTSFHLPLGFIIRHSSLFRKLSGWPGSHAWKPSDTKDFASLSHR